MKLYNEVHTEIDDENDDVILPKIDEYIEQGYNDIIDLSIENIKLTNIQINTLSTIKSKLINNYSDMNIVMEQYRDIIKNIAINLNIKTYEVSYEDLSNKNMFHESRNITLESIGEFLKNLWKRIKEFFTNIFNAFVKLIFNSNNNENKHENLDKILEKRIKELNIRSSIFKSNGPIDSLLPKYLSYHEEKEYTNSDLLATGVNKLTTFIYTIKKFNTIQNKVISKLEHSKDLIDPLSTLEKYISSINDKIDINRNDINVIINDLKVMIDNIDNIALKNNKTILDNSIFKEIELYEVSEELRNTIEENNFVNYKLYLLYSNDNVFNIEVYLIIYNKEEDKEDFMLYIEDKINDKVSAKLDPLESVEDINILYNVYKELVKTKFIMDKKILDDISKNNIDKIKSIMEKITEHLNNIRRKLYKLSFKNEEDTELTDLYKILIETFNDLEIHLNLLNNNIADVLTRDIKSFLEIPKYYMSNKNKLINELAKYLVESIKCFKFI